MALILRPYFSIYLFINEGKTIKAKLYGRYGIKDYGVIDVKERKLSLFRKPHKLGYETKQMLGENETIIPLNFPEICVKISELLAPKIEINKNKLEKSIKKIN